MRALNSRLRKIELIRNIKQEAQEVKFIFIMYASSTDDEEKNVIGIKSKDTFHKLEERESVNELIERITPLYKGGGVQIMLYIYEDDKLDE